jgi:hypothetical protein
LATSWRVSSPLQAAGGQITIPNEEAVQGLPRGMRAAGEKKKM